MADQKTLEDGAARVPLRRLRRNVAEVLRDVAEMAELQWKLLVVDGRRCRARVFFGLVFVGLTAVLLPGTGALALAALAMAMVQYAGLSFASAFGCAALIGVAASVLLATSGWWSLRGASTAFDRSRYELRRNVAWLKVTLKNTRSTD